MVDPYCIENLTDVAFLSSYNKPQIFGTYHNQKYEKPHEYSTFSDTVDKQRSVGLVCSSEQYAPCLRRDNITVNNPTVKRDIGISCNKSLIRIGITV